VFNKRFLLLSLFVLVGIKAKALKLDISVHDELIQRLESAMSAGIDAESENTVRLRLADLYADRARLKAIQLQDGICRECEDVKEDRNRAIALYEKSFKQANAEQKTKILLQSAHLHAANGNSKKSESIFKDILANSKKYPSNLTGEAHVGLGEIHYRKGEFSQATEHFKAALKYDIRQPHIAEYRLAWCEFNAGKNAEGKAALYRMIKNKSLNDESFKRDVARDLVTFVARDPISRESVSELLSVTPPEDHKANLFLLGKEAERLGNAKGALIAWALYAEMKGTDDSEALEIQIRTAQMLADRGQYADAIKAYDGFYKNLDKLKCKKIESICAELRAHGRQLVLTWIKKEKANPSESLTAALTVYTQYNAEDLEMLEWTGHVARANNNFKVASSAYGKAAKLAAKSNDKKRLESTLLFQIEMAEQNKNNELMLEAYNSYLHLNPNGDKVNEIKYQKAFTLKNMGQMKEAFELFDDLVAKVNEPLRTQSADLALDALAKLNDSDKLEVVALGYAKLIDKKKNAYTEIARKAAVNSAIILAQKNKNLVDAYEKLKNAPLTGAKHEERLLIAKNQLLIAEQMNDLDRIDESAIKLLSLTRTPDDKELALSRRFYVANQRGQFKSAYEIGKKMHMPKLHASDRALKLAILADLSGIDSRKHYEEFIAKTPSKDKANTARAKIIKESRSPWHELRKHEASLRRSPQIYAETVSEVFARNQNYNELKRHLNYQELKNSNEGRRLKLFFALKDTNIFKKKIASHRLNSRSDKAIQSSIKERLNILKEGERLAAQSIKSNSFSLQVIYMSILSTEYNRLAKNIKTLPTPRGLSQQEKKKYLDLVSQRALALESTANHFSSQVDKLFSGRSFDNIITLGEKAEYAEARLLAHELSFVLPHAPQSAASEIRSLVSRSLEKRPVNTLQVAYLEQVEKRKLQ
jgi:hypothetical protein